MTNAPGSYRALLGTPGARLFSLAALVGRMPIAMLGIGSVLLVQDRRGSYALAGAVAAAYALGLALGGPGVGRLVDRRGQARVLPWCAALSGAALLALVVAAGTALPGAVLLALALLCGGTLPPLGSCVRARWTWALHEQPGLVGTAMAWESVADEVVFLAGPALVVVLAALLDPSAGLGTALVLSLAGTAAFAAQRGTEPPVHPHAAEAGSAVRSAGLRTLVLAMVCVGVLFGSLEVVMVAFAQAEGHRSAAGYLLPLIALGSACSGLVYGSIAWRSPLPRRLLVALVALAVGVLPVVLAPGLGWMVPAALLAGLAVSPTLILGAGLVEQLVAPAVRTEGFTWLNSGLGVGVALGSAVGGALAQGAGARTAFLTALAGALAALVTVSTGRASLAAPAVAWA